MAIIATSSQAGLLEQVSHLQGLPSALQQFERPAFRAPERRTTRLFLPFSSLRFDSIEQALRLAFRLREIEKWGKRGPMHACTRGMALTPPEASGLMSSGFEWRRASCRVSRGSFLHLRTKSGKGESRACCHDGRAGLSGLSGMRGRGGRRAARRRACGDGDATCILSHLPPHRLPH